MEMEEPPRGGGQDGEALVGVWNPGVQPRARLRVGVILFVLGGRAVAAPEQPMRTDGPAQEGRGDGGLVMDLLGAVVEVHCLRDLTRGGLASALVEIAEDRQ